jgi:hypothetical protein
MGKQVRLNGVVGMEKGKAGFARRLVTFTPNYTASHIGKILILPYTACDLQTSYPLLNFSFNVTKLFLTKIVFVFLMSPQPLSPANISLTIVMSLVVNSNQQRERS